jgi:hypothetical protein
LLSIWKLRSNRSEAVVTASVGKALILTDGTAGTVESVGYVK